MPSLRVAAVRMGVQNCHSALVTFTIEPLLYITFMLCSKIV